ncbi:hypothetical protein J8J27_26875, partial [Mycobacterium tuberculosis]|nr:hypothetical protein [Mycobacterium tuberculosis]
MTNVLKGILKSAGSRRALALGAVSTVVAGALAAEVFVAPLAPAKAQIAVPVGQAAIQGFTFADIVERVKPAVVSI